MISGVTKVLTAEGQVDDDVEGTEMLLEVAALVGEHGPRLREGGGIEGLPRVRDRSRGRAIVTREEPNLDVVLSALHDEESTAVGIELLAVGRGAVETDTAALALVDSGVTVIEASITEH